MSALDQIKFWCTMRAKTRNSALNNNRGLTGTGDPAPVWGWAFPPRRELRGGLPVENRGSLRLGAASARTGDVCFHPKSGHSGRWVWCPLCANRRHCALGL